ncbi:antibiotic biosynthesis monooxygenase [Cryobacterium sp. CG_9.6]|uniref:putative quinol monooxygenase n=1 Tax=Cryobacterium sp. CG_9.6 TaxID=2760710 RepID=UPI00247558D3|nr:antibiotic biosynthesis monooxygenase [Cryobacterium sp. CG_9.6]MDH6237688.1 quinol monooxygenase YgiN [Cryobacterium sp. CG_9.6]
MITAMLDLRIKPESLAISAALISRVLTQTRAFAGNAGVDVLVDTDDETHVVVVELWDSLESDVAYREWRATEEGQSDLGTILADAPTLTKFSTTVAL